MKIGFSFGRCIRDIVTEKVAYDDVLVIVTRTHIDQVDQIDPVIDSYLDSRMYLMGLDPDECIAMGRRLFKEGKLHQPRAYGAGVGFVPEEKVWMDVVPTDLNDNPVVKSAWENYRMMLNMARDDRTTSFE